jgi:hypothetical protein
MQSHAGPNSCVGIDPCPTELITGMLLDGAAGTPSGDGLAAIMDTLTALSSSPSNSTQTPEQVYYRTARTYNSGSIASPSSLGDSAGATNCYVSDIANRLMGWVWAGSSCTAANAYVVSPGVSDCWRDVSGEGSTEFSAFTSTSRALDCASSSLASTSTLS